MWSFIFFFNDTATTEIYTLSLHDALPIFEAMKQGAYHYANKPFNLDELSILVAKALETTQLDRKSTRLNSSHVKISYAVFCLKKKKKKENKKAQLIKHNKHTYKLT